MLRLLWRVLRLTVLLLALGVGVYFFHGPLLAPIGRHLVATDPLEPSDWIVVLAGSPYLSAAEAARLYHERWAPAILLTNQPRPRGQDDLLRLGVPVKDSQETARGLLGALRVPAEAVKTLPDRSGTMVDELQAVRRFLAGHAIRGVILVPSKVQSARARRLCQAELGPTTRCTIRPPAGDSYDPTRWWMDREDVAAVVQEYAALITDMSRSWWRSVGTQSVPPAVTIR